jgi:hypothetical protein
MVAPAQRNSSQDAYAAEKGGSIQLIRPIAGVAVGTRGIILRRFTFDRLYDVWFDGYAAPGQHARPGTSTSGSTASLSPTTRWALPDDDPGAFLRPPQQIGVIALLGRAVCRLQECLIALRATPQGHKCNVRGVAQLVFGGIPYSSGCQWIVRQLLGAVQTIA